MDKKISCFTPNGIITTEVCPVCQGQMTVEHGRVGIYDPATSVEDTITLQHREVCEECGESYPIVCYDCEHCMAPYFLTVEWCDKGGRGVFCRKDGALFRKDNAPHTKAEMQEILGLFSIILSPESKAFTLEMLADYTRWRSLAEYSGELGIALKPAEETVQV